LVGKHPGVKFIEPDGTMFAVPEMPSEDPASLLERIGRAVPWGLDRIDAEEGQDGTYSVLAGENTHVYVADSGVLCTHDDFGGRGIPTIDCATGSGICEECEANSTTCSTDRHGHGTHCAGSVGSKTYGVAKLASVHSVKILTDEGVGSFSAFVQALDWVSTKALRPAVFSASLGTKGVIQSIQTAIDSAVDAGVTVVVAAGNEGDDACLYSPSFVPSAITVGATTGLDSMAGFSNWGSCVDIFAPGASITSTGISSETSAALMSGTSMACPHVAGAAAILLGQNSSLTPAEIETLLVSGATPDKVGNLGVGSPNLLLHVQPNVEKRLAPAPSPNDNAANNAGNTGAAPAPNQEQVGQDTTAQEAVELIPCMPCRSTASSPTATVCTAVLTKDGPNDVFDQVKCVPACEAIESGLNNQGGACYHPSKHKQLKSYYRCDATTTTTTAIIIPEPVEGIMFTVFAASVGAVLFSCFCFCCCWRNERKDIKHNVKLRAKTGVEYAKQNIPLKLPTGLRKSHTKLPSLGVLRLDYNYPPAVGDVASPASFGYDVIYRVVPGLTFSTAQSGMMSHDVSKHLESAIAFLEDQGVSAITGDCGFMMSFQKMANKFSTVPTFLSSMVQCPPLCFAMGPEKKILLLTANGEALRKQKDVLLSSLGFNVDFNQFLISGCESVPGFDAVAKGQKVNLELVQKGIVDLVKRLTVNSKDIAGILLECTELPPYADAIRYTTGLPVWDAITLADYFISAFSDKNFQENTLRSERVTQQPSYSYGQNLTQQERAKLVNQYSHTAPAITANTRTPHPTSGVGAISQKPSPSLGVLCLDSENLSTEPPEVVLAGSDNFNVVQRVVAGLNREVVNQIVQSGVIAPEVQKQIVAAIANLEERGVHAITGECSAMVVFNEFARKVAKVPVFMTPMIQWPLLSTALDIHDQILVMTADAGSGQIYHLKDKLKATCGVDLDNKRIIMLNCQSVQELGVLKNVTKLLNKGIATAGMIAIAKDAIKRSPRIRAICLESSRLAPFADSLRNSLQLPVFDAVTAADLFVCAYKDSPRFGINRWQASGNKIAMVQPRRMNLSMLSSEPLA